MTRCRGSHGQQAADVQQISPPFKLCHGFIIIIYFFFWRMMVVGVCVVGRVQERVQTNPGFIGDYRPQSLTHSQRLR